MTASRNTFAEVIDLVQRRRDSIWETCERFQLAPDLAKRDATLAEYDAALALLRAAAEPESTWPTMCPCPDPQCNLPAEAKDEPCLVCNGHDTTQPRCPRCNP